MKQQRLDVAVRDLYRAPGPYWHTTWQVAVLFGINDSTVRNLVRAGRFDGAVRNEEGEWMVPSQAVAQRLLSQRREYPEPSPPREPQTYALYRWYDIDDELLYVGQSKNAPRRTKQHERDKQWWELVNHCTVEHFATRQEVTLAEANAIQAENPRFNIVRRPG